MMENEAFAFSIMFINDAQLRADYQAKVKAASNEILARVKLREITPHEGAQTANAIRNHIMDLTRARTSSYGLALAKHIKQQGKLLSVLCEEKAVAMFRSPFNALSAAQQDQVYLEIIQSAGRTNPKVNVQIRYFKMSGRALLIFSLAVSVYSVAEAEDKERQALKEASTTGASLLGALGAGAGVALVVSNPAGWVVGLSALVGGALTGLASDTAFDYYYPEK
ncbi:hypothetical protein [Chitiniphilus shinanonensis]